jgi:hypothetical protein
VDRVGVWGLVRAQGLAIVRGGSARPGCGIRFEPYILRLPRAAIVVVIDEDERILMMWRHRFILDRWV